MKVSFYHDARLKYDGNQTYYASNGLTKRLFKKYLSGFEELTVITRKERILDNHNIKAYTEISTDGVKFKCIDRLRFFSLLLGKDRYKIRKEIIKTDLAIIRMPSIIGIVATQEAKANKTPYIVELVGCPWDSLWNYGRLRYKIVAPLLYLINRYIVWFAPNVVYVSEKFLQQRYPTKGRLLSCSDVQLENSNVKNLNLRIEKINKINSGHVYKIGTVASVNLKFKGHKYVISALKNLKLKGFKCEYYLVGDGDGSSLIKFAKKCGVLDNIHMLGPIPHNKVFNFMSDLDIYIQPSDAESHGRVILEAFSVGCPVIGSSTGGIPELVDSKYIFKRRNISDLEGKILIATKRNELMEQSINNFNMAKMFDKKLLDKKRKDFYMSVIKKGVTHEN